MKRSYGITMAELRLHTPSQSDPAGRVIGWLSQIGDTLRVSFSDDYVRDPRRPTLSQLYRGETGADTTAILTALHDERLVRIGRLPAFFSNLLPEGVNRERLAQQRGCDVDDELELLAAAGHDLSGALEVLPALDVPSHVIERHATQHREPLEAWAVAAPMEDGFSVDGFQTKFSMVHDGRRYTVRRNSGAGEFIAKLPSTAYPDLARNEGACYRLAAAAGVATAQASVASIKDLDVPPHVVDAFEDCLVVKRFDRFKRPDGSTGRIHFEELSQALGIDSRHKYRNLQGAMRALLVILKASDASQADFDEFFRRWTVHALIGNSDAHAKNWGLLYPDGVRATLAPAYDLVCVAAYFDPSDERKLAQNRAMDRSLRSWGEDAAEALAKQAGLLSFNRARRIVRDTRKLAAASWPALLADAPTAVRETITERLRAMAPQATPASRPSGGMRPR